MKILQIIEFFTPTRGGSVNVIYNLSKELAKNGHDVTIITTDFEFDKKYAQSIEKDNVIVIPFHCIVNIGSFLVSPSIKKWLKENIKDFDIVHMHNYRTYQNCVVYYYAKKYKVHFILQAHGSVLPFFTKIKIKKIYDLIWGFKILRNASKVFALTETEEEQYNKMGVKPNKIEIIPNGIDIDKYENLPKQGTFRKKYGINDSEKIILYIGRLHPSKGLDLLVYTFADFIQQINFYKLVIIGPDDDYKPQLEQIIKELGIDKDIIFTNFVSNEEKMAALVDADVFVTPRFYGSPITFLEACTCGTPIVTTDAGDKLDWIDDKVGFIVNYDKDQLKNAIIKIFNNDELKKKFQTEEYRLIKEKFNWIIITRDVEKIYYKIKPHKLYK